MGDFHILIVVVCSPWLSSVWMKEKSLSAAENVCSQHFLYNLFVTAYRSMQCISV